MKNFFINIILISLVIIMVVIVTKDEEAEEIVKKRSYEFLSGERSINKVTEEIVEVNKYPKEKVDEIYKGYSVCAKLVIPTISLETNVLENFSEEALNTSVVKFWGVNPNENGNFCIAGHNFINKNMFRNLKKLNIGDRLFLIDNKIGKVEYEVFKIDTVLPDNVNCLKEITDSEKEVTLITCTSNSKKRIIVKAKEVKR